MWKCLVIQRRHWTPSLNIFKISDQSRGFFFFLLTKKNTNGRAINQIMWTCFRTCPALGTFFDFNFFLKTFFSFLTVTGPTGEEGCCNFFLFLTCMYWLANAVLSTYSFPFFSFFEKTKTKNKSFICTIARQGFDMDIYGLLYRGGHDGCALLQLTFLFFNSPVPGMSQNTTSIG